MSYRAPLADMRFVLDHVADLPSIAGYETYAHATQDVVDAALDQAAKLAADTLAPIDRGGDQEGARAANGVVTTPKGYKEAYRTYVEGGWNGVPFDPEFGGQGMPWAFAIAVQEMWSSANMAWNLCPLLNQGAVEAVSAHGSDEQKRLFLAKMIEGIWTGTMNLTEPQAGSDVGALRARAEPVGDGTWRIFGQKIFITFGEHDMAENIVHLVLARTPGSPPGTKGISLFLVPKFLVKPDGSLGARNDLRCVSIEHKLGIHGSPTCVMSYGDQGGAIGTMLGGENGGMRCMFTMMNNARLSVGLQGLAVAERAYQQAVAYARERKQGRPAGRPATEHAPIVVFPDIRRNLMTMRAGVEAMRALVYFNASAIDRAKAHPDVEERERQKAMVELLTPVSKAWSTDLGCELASINVQVHGGMGFIEETGAAQYYRDARITPIYEGTNGIQAIDLVMRKLPLRGGGALRDWIGGIKALDGDLAAFPDIQKSLAAGVAALERASLWMGKQLAADPDAALAGAQPYLKMFGIVTGGFFLAKSALIAKALLAKGGPNAAFLKAKIATARYYAQQILPQAIGLEGPATAGSEMMFALSEDELAA
ncbi:MAG: acyl-CoA dehydrogenase [Alphaproteobacteria bacterium]|nr:acyl-CoA dehydrogenase [Alphaproteobacteria bacterium]